MAGRGGAVLNQITGFDSVPDLLIIAREIIKINIYIYLETYHKFMLLIFFLVFGFMLCTKEKPTLPTPQM